MSRILLVLGLLVACLTGGPLAGDSATRIPENLRGGGEIDGRGAIAVFPDDGFDAASCSAHVVLENDLDAEATYPCGKWVLPPAYGTMLRAWAEDGVNMSPFPERFIPRDAAPGTMVAVAAPERAGRVALHGFSEENGRVALRLLDADPMPLRAGWLPHENLRSLPPARWEEGALMPAGRAVAWLWDLDRRQILALSKPFPVPAASLTEAPISAGSGVIAVLNRPYEAQGANETLSIEIKTSAGSRRPDLVVPTAAGYYAFFYGALEGAAELSANTDTLLLPLQQFEIREGGAEMIAAELVRRPRLEAELRLPQELLTERLSLEVVSVATQKVAASRQVARKGSNEIFENLSADLFELRLQSSFGTFTATADLRPALDLAVQLEPQLIEIAGKVLLDGEGHSALLKFTTVRGEVLECHANDVGEYRLLTLEHLKFVSVDLENGQAPFIDFFEKPLAASRILDFELNANGYRVKVLSTRTSKPVPDAMIVFRNSFPAPPAELPSRGGQAPLKIVAQSVTTGEDGAALLPSLRPGTIELRASAPGFREKAEPSVFSIEEGVAASTFEILLDPQDALSDLELHQADGSPAAGAEVALVSNLDSERVLFGASCDAQGVVSIPNESGLLLIRHPGSASRVVPWPPADTPALIRLDVAAPPLILRIENAERRVMGRAQVALWLGGRKLEGSTLSWLYYCRDSADLDGYVRLTGVPAAPVEILAWAPERFPIARSGVLDAQAVEVIPPWPATIVVQGQE